MIINLGLPRTGTTSLAEAATILGFRNLSHPIAGPVWSSMHKNRKVDSGALETVKGNWSARFVCTTRNLDTWLPSVMSRFPQGNADTFEQIYKSHETEVHAAEMLLHDAGEKLVWLDLDSENGVNWHPICILIDPFSRIPHRNYPHNSKR